MNRSFAYICAPTSYDGRISKRLKEYRRELYDLGYLPICPSMMFSQFLSGDVAQERNDLSTMSQEILRRCRVVVVCSNDVSDDMEKDILLAKRIGIVTTTLAGIRKTAAITTKGENDE